MNPSISTLQSSLQTLRFELSDLFLERADLIDGTLAALFCKGNIFIGGNPGTGKTALINTIAACFDANYFYYLVDATTTKDELFGSVDMEELLKNSKFTRDLDGGIATSHFVALDEGFKCNSPTLNSILGLMLDRVVQNGKRQVASPLVSMAVMSNELPQDDSLRPFWDRLNFRFWVNEVTDASLQTLLERSWGLEETPAITAKFTLDDLKVLQEYAGTLPCEANVPAALVKLRQGLADLGIEASTRKWMQITSMLRAYAVVIGDSIVTIEHIQILRHVLWNKPEEIERLGNLIDQITREAEIEVEQLIADARQSISAVLVAAEGESPTAKRARLAAASHRIESIRGEVVRLSEGASQRRQAFWQKRLAELDTLQSAITYQDGTGYFSSKN